MAVDGSSNGRARIVRRLIWPGLSFSSGEGAGTKSKYGGALACKQLQHAQFEAKRLRQASNGIPRLDTYEGAQCGV